MAKKKNGYVREDFETAKPRGKFISLFDDMIESKAYLELTAHDIMLYIKLRQKYTVKKVNGVIVGSNKDDISMPKREYEKFMHQNTFYKSIDNLIDKGFIRVIRNGRFSKQCNIYGFVSMWQHYGTDKFNVPNSWRRAPIKQE